MKRSRYNQPQITVVLVMLWLKFTNSGSAFNQTTPSMVDQKRFQKIENSMGWQYSPCDNFFRYACEEWYNSTEPLITESITMVDSVVLEELSNIFQAEDFNTEPNFLQNIHRYYLSCKNAEDSQQALEYLKWMRDHEHINWPLAWKESKEQEQEGNCNWVELLATTRRYGFNLLFFREDITQRSENPYKMIVELNRPALADLENFKQQVLDISGIDPRKIFDKFKSFHKALKKRLKALLPPLREEGDSQVQLVRLKDLQMPWLNKYFSVLLNQSFVETDMELYVEDIDYMRQIYEFLSNYENNFLCDFIEIKFLIFLNEEDSLRNRGICLDSVRQQFPLAMQWIYGEKHIELQQDIEPVQTLFSNLKQQFKKTLTDSVYRFQGKTLEYLLAKLDQLKLKIFDITREELEHYYESLRLNSTSYHGNRLKLNNFKFKTLHDSLAQPLQGRSSIEFYDSRPRVAGSGAQQQIAVYNLPYLYPRLNVIFMPWTMLQYPYYSSSMSDVYAYSAIGFHLAREIIKAFDYRFLSIDGRGVFNYEIFDDLMANYKFKKLAQKLTNNFEEYDTNELIDDLDGLKLVYDTFVSLHPEILNQQLTLNNRSRTMEKLFFLNYAHNFCAPLCGPALAIYEHYNLCDRVNVPLMNFGIFRTAFECKRRGKWAHPIWHLGTERN